VNSLTIDQIDRQSPSAVVAESLFRPAIERCEPDSWWTWPNVVAGFHEAVDSFLDDVPRMHQPEADRGIVIVGGGEYLPSVYVTVRVLRHVGCQLPIEVWHFDGEDDPQLTPAFEPYGVEFINANQVATQRPFRFLHWHWWKGWQLKSFALCNSKFREVLFLDADCYPNRDPEYLFDWDEFQRAGCVLWPDVEHSPTALKPSTFRLFEIEQPNDRLTESGQILLDREKVWRPLSLAAFYNQCADIVYRYIWGDKDTFPFAWRRCGVPYSRMWPECELQADSILQYDFHGHVIFQHRVGDKFKLEGSQFASTTQSWSENRFHPELAHESFCFYVLNELRMLQGS
jgi:hypothetical protein